MSNYAKMVSSHFYPTNTGTIKLLKIITDDTTLLHDGNININTNIKVKSP
jgi:hypothetical protein